MTNAICILLFVLFSLVAETLAPDPPIRAGCIQRTKTRFLEIQLDRQCAKGILMCYKSPMEPNAIWKTITGAKVGRRFQLPNLDGSMKNSKFSQCNDDGSRGVIISLEKDGENQQQQNIKLETSFGANFSCAIDRNTFGINLHSIDGILSSIKGCKEIEPCDKAAKLSTQFGFAERHLGPFLQDFVDIGLIGLDMLLAENATIERNQLCTNNRSNWKIDIHEKETEQPLCGKKGPKHLYEGVNETIKRKGRLEFPVELLNLGCNSTLYEEKKKVKDRGLQSRIAEKACYAMDNSSQDCNPWNSMTITVCYESKLGESELMQELKLDNQQNNSIANLCQKHKPPSDNGRTKSVRHGFALKVCVKRNALKKMGDKYEIEWKIRGTLSLSYSDQRYEFERIQRAQGRIKHKEYWRTGSTYDRLAPPKLNQFNFIAMELSNSHIRDENLISLNTKLDHMNGTVRNCEGVIGRTRKELQQIAKGNDALALLAIDMVGTRGDDWVNHLQLLVSPRNKCHNIGVMANGANYSIMPDCYQRPPNIECEKIGIEKYDEWVANVKELKLLQKKCPCHQRAPPPWAANLTTNNNNNENNRPPPFKPWQKMSGVNNNTKRGCNDTDPNDITFGDIIQSREVVERDLENQWKCCPKNLRESLKRKMRRKRQFIDYGFYRSGLWPNSMNILYEINADVEDPFHDIIEDGIELIEKVTCLRFEQFDGSDAKRIVFKRDRDPASRCRSMVGTNPDEIVHDVFIGGNCLYTCQNMAHEVIHALGLRHEWLRDDRADWVWINLKECSADCELDTNTDHLELPFEYDSIMLYGSGTHTLVYEEGFQRTFETSAWDEKSGQLSFKDAKMLNLLYCTRDGSNPIPPHNNAQFDDKSVFTRCNRNSPEWKNSGCLINGGYPDPTMHCQRCRCPMGYKSGGVDCTEIEDSDKECETTELTATPHSKILSYPFDLNEPPSTRKNRNCIWRIKTKTTAEAMKTKISVEIIELEGFDEDKVCKKGPTESCKQWLEVKHHQDKTATGARICCPLYKGHFPTLTAQKYGQEVLLILHDPYGTTRFKINFKAAHQDMRYGNNCPPISTLNSRNPEFPVLVCSSRPCDQVISGIVNFNCNWRNKLTVNGIEHVGKCTPEQMEVDPECFETATIKCLATEDSGDRWFFEDKDGELIRTNQFICLPRKKQ